MAITTEVDPLVHPTRSALFAGLRELRRAATTEELANQLGLHVNGVRRHLQLMQASGLLERRRVRHGRGRPRDEWSIAPDAKPGGAEPESYREIAAWLARAIPTGPRRVREVEQSGREIGGELAPARTGNLADSIRQAFSGLGFQPVVEIDPGGTLSCVLSNCPYREAVHENQAAVCALHRGITVGLIERLDPEAKLTRFEPHDPDRAGCIVEVAGNFSGSSEPLSQ